MAKVKGPLLSVSASGKFKNLMEFRTGGGKTVVAGQRQKMPARSFAQQAQSDKFLESIEAWRGAGATVRAAWKAHSGITGMTGYQYFLSEYSSQHIVPPNLPVIP